MTSARTTYSSAHARGRLLADEPTGQLDSETGRGIVTMLRGLVHDQGITALMATHDPTLIDLADQVIELRDGRVATD